MNFGFLNIPNRYFFYNKNLILIHNQYKIKIFYIITQLNVMTLLKLVFNSFNSYLKSHLYRDIYMIN